MERMNACLKNARFEETCLLDLHKKFYTWMLALSAVYSVAIMPLLNLVNSDVLYSDSILSPVLDLVLLVCGYLIFWVAFSYLLYGIARFGIGNVKKMVLAFVGVNFFRLAIGYLMGYWMGIGAFVWLDLRDLLVSAAIDCLQLLVAVWIIKGTERKLVAKHKLKNHLPLAGMFPRKNPVTVVIGKLAMIPAGIHLITRVIFDLKAEFVGAPESWLDYLWIFLGYFSDIAFAFVGYLAIVLIVNSLALGVERAEIEFEDAAGFAKKSTPDKRK